VLQAERSERDALGSERLLSLLVGFRCCFIRPSVWDSFTLCGSASSQYGWMPHNAGFGFLDLAPSILHSNWFWDYIS
jgi:hypothetical protein